LHSNGKWVKQYGKMNCKFVLFTFYHDKSGFFMFIHYFTLITNTEVSKMTCRYPMQMIMDKKLLRYDVFLFVSYGFDLKPQVPFIRSCTCEKHENVIERCFISFPGSMWLHEKGTPLELTLSSFHDSLNMKRLPSDLALFTLVKVFEVTRPSSDSLTLFRSRWTIVRKRN
jgi:hypothetical protein